MASTSNMDAAKGATAPVKSVYFAAGLSQGLFGDDPVESDRKPSE